MDRWGRFPYAATRWPDIERPWVSEWIYGQGFKPVYPEGKTWAVVLSHDVDFLYRKPLGLAKRSGQALGNGQWQSAVENAKRIFSKSYSPEWHPNLMLEAEAKYGAHSSWYWLALRNGEQDWNYDLGQTGDLAKAIQQAGGNHELHGGHEAWRNTSVLGEERKRFEAHFNHSPKGYRNHYLRLSTPQTWPMLEQHGFEHDSTLAFAEKAGFRGGMAYPYKPWNWAQNRFYDFFEIPLTLMDTGLIEHQKIAPENLERFCAPLLQAAAAINGVAGLLWHNNNTEGKYMDLYPKILAHCAAEGAWFCSAYELLEYWKSKNYDFLIDSFLSNLMSENDKR